MKEAELFFFKKKEIVGLSKNTSKLHRK